MGNCGSNPVTTDNTPDYDNPQPLSEEEIMKRIVASEASQVLKYDENPSDVGKGSYEIRFAFVSQKGYYPNGEFGWLLLLLHPRPQFRSLTVTAPCL